jgi:hypothetical protein
VDASDVGWEACAYQMKDSWTGDPAEEGRMQIGDTGERLVIQGIGNGWTMHDEIQLPVFYYREALGRLPALVSFGISSIIEINIETGITLYTADHKQHCLKTAYRTKDSSVHEN